MFFLDKPAAFREMRRVLAPGGRLLFSTWGAVQTHGFAAALVAGLAEIARGHSGSPYDWLCAIGGLAYLLAVAFSAGVADEAAVWRGRPGMAGLPHSFFDNVF